MGYRSTAYEQKQATLAFSSHLKRTSEQPQPREPSWIKIASPASLIR